MTIGIACMGAFQPEPKFIFNTISLGIYIMIILYNINNKIINFLSFFDSPRVPFLIINTYIDI